MQAVATPTRVLALGGVHMTAVAAGLSHTVAVSSDGAAYGWGSNADGQLGVDDDADADAMPVGAQPTLIGGTDSVLADEHIIQVCACTDTPGAVMHAYWVTLLLYAATVQTMSCSNVVSGLRAMSLKPLGTDTILPTALTGQFWCPQ